MSGLDNRMSFGKGCSEGHFYRGKEGDISIEVRQGTFLSSFDKWLLRGLTSVDLLVTLRATEASRFIFFWI